MKVAVQGVDGRLDERAVTPGEMVVEVAAGRGRGRTGWLASKMTVMAPYL